METGVLLLRCWVVSGRGGCLGAAGGTGGGDVGADIHGEFEEEEVRWG